MPVPWQAAYARTVPQQVPPLTLPIKRRQPVGTAAIATQQLAALAPVVPLPAIIPTARTANVGMAAAIG